MEVDFDAASVQRIYQQLRQRNAFSTGFADVSEAYQRLLRQCRELKVWHLSSCRVLPVHTVPVLGNAVLSHCGTFPGAQHAAGQGGAGAARGEHGHAGGARPRQARGDQRREGALY